MDHHRQKSNSGDSFSFPSTPSSTDQDYEFEFGSITPDSPYKNSPADHLFSNGRLLPHSFPIPISQFNYNNATAVSRSTSRRSSVSSKDSLVSSRSNSTNSRSSCSSSSSSARTSSSDSSERNNKLLYYKSSGKAAAAAHVYGSSQRWQFIAPVPVLNREMSSSRRKVNNKGHVHDQVLVRKEDGSLRKKKKKQGKDGGGGERRRFGRRFFGWLLLACRECHAMEPTRRDDVAN